MTRSRSALALTGVATFAMLAGAASLGQPPNDPTKPSQPPTQQPKPGESGRDLSPGKQPSNEMEKAWKEAGAPGEFHQKLRVFAGDWEGTVRCYDEGAQPTQSSTTMHATMGLGGRFLQLKVDGRMHDEPFDGSGVIGYNNLSKQYESSWIDSLSTGICHMTGTADSSGKVFTFTGEMIAISADKASIEFYMTGPDGKENKTGDVTLSKSGGAAKGFDDKGKKDSD